LNFAGLRVAYVFGIVAGILLAILNTLLLFGVHKVLLFKPAFVIAY